MNLSALPLITPFLKDFPIEIYNEILKFCDPSTLAKTSRVSLAFLELSSPLLYRDVKLIGFEQMEKLFCDRKSSQPLVEHHLSLHRIRTFDIIVPIHVPRMPSFSLDRSPSSRPLDVDELQAQIERRSSFALHLFNPSLAIFKGFPSRQWPGLDPTYTGSSVYRCQRAPVKWPRLSKLVLRDISLELEDSSFTSFTSSSPPTSVPLYQRYPSQRAQDRLRDRSCFQPLLFISPWETRRGALETTWLVRDLKFVLDGLSNLVSGGRAVKEVVVRVVEAEEEYMEREVVMRMGKDMVERLKEEGKLRFEVFEEE